MGASVRPESDRDRLVRQVKLLRQKGATDDDVRAFLDAQGGGGVPDSAPPAHRDVLGTGKAVAAGAVRGSSAGFADEIFGAMAAAPYVLPTSLAFDVTKVPAAYREMRDRYRAAEHAARAAHPRAALIGEIGGALAPALLTGGGTAPSSLLAAMGRGAATGAGFGAASGLGTAEGPAQQQAVKALEGALLGGALGGAVPVAAAGLGSVARAAKTAIGPRTPAAVDEQALSLLARALERGDRTPAALASAAESFAGKPATLHDVGGPSVERLTRSVATAPGRGSTRIQEALAERAAGAGERVAGDVRSAFGRESPNVYDLLEEITTRQRATAGPLYEQAYARGTVDDPRIAEILQDPAFAAATKRALRIAKREGVTLDPAKPTVQLLDYVKRGIDDVVDAGFRSGKLGKMEAAGIQQMKRELLDRLDEAVPEYGAARAAFRGEAELKDAVDAGKRLVGGALAGQGDPRVVERALAALSPGEQEAFRLGAQDAVEQALASTADGRNPVARLFGTPNRRALLESVLPEGAYEEFVRRMGAEAELGAKGRIPFGGSNTANKLADTDDAQSAILAAAGQAVTGRPGRAALTLAQRGVDRFARGQTERVNETLADYLMTHAGSSEFDDLQRALADVARRSSARGGGRLSRTASAFAGEEAGLGGRPSR